MKMISLIWVSINDNFIDIECQKLIALSIGSSSEKKWWNDEKKIQKRKKNRDFEKKKIVIWVRRKMEMTTWTKILRRHIDL